MEAVTLPLLALTVVNASVNASVAAPFCAKRVPVAKYFEYGYDMSEFDVFACPDVFKDSKDIDVQIGGKRAKFIDINTCEKGNIYTYADTGRTVYDIPDQFNTPYNPTSFYQNEHVYTRMGEISEDFIKTQTQRNVFDRQYDTEHRFFRNSQFYDLFNKMFAKQSKVAAIFNRVYTFGMTINENYNKARFSPQFVADINGLPEKFEGNEKIFLDFIAKYGTHVLVNGTFGGMVYRYAEILNGSSNEDEIVHTLRKDAMSVDRFNNVCNVWSGWRQILVAKTLKFTQVIVGGFGNSEGYRNRGLPLEEYFRIPALLSAEVAPISELITDSKEKEESVKKAILIHLYKAYIRARVKEIENVKEIGGLRIREKTNELLLKAEQSKNITNREELMKLGDDLKHEAFYVQDIRCSFC